MSQKVQDSFYGCKFGSYMYHMQKAMNEKGYENYKEDEDMLSVNNVRFGGYEWAFASFVYHDKKLYNVSLSQNYKSKESAIDRFNSAKNALKNKYQGICWEKKDEQSIDELNASDDERLMRLVLKYSRSNGGEMFYYVNLDYYDIDLLRESVKRYDSEL